MVQKESIFIPVDKSGVWSVKVIHAYVKMSRILNTGGFGKMTVRECSPTSWLSRKRKRKFLLVRVSHVTSRPCGLQFKSYNGGLLLKKRLTPVGRRVLGFINKEVIRKRAIASFVSIL